MSENFNDARVLRSETTTLTKKQIKMLLSNLEQGEYGVADLRKLDSLASKMMEVIQEYSDTVDDLTQLVQDTGVAANQPVSQEFRLASQNLGRYVTESGGENVQDIIITLTEYDFLKSRWNANSRLIGIKSVRADILAIDDVIQHALGVKFVGKSKLAWIRGEPEPEQLSGS